MIKASDYYLNIWKRNSLLLPVSLDLFIEKANKGKIRWLISYESFENNKIAAKLELCKNDVLALKINKNASNVVRRMIIATFLVDTFNKNYQEIYYGYEIYDSKNSRYFEALRLLAPEYAIDTLVKREGISSFSKIANILDIDETSLMNRFIKDNLMSFSHYYKIQ